MNTLTLFLRLTFTVTLTLIVSLTLCMSLTFTVTLTIMRHRTRTRTETVPLNAMNDSLRSCVTLIRVRVQVGMTSPGPCITSYTVTSRPCSRIVCLMRGKIYRGKGKG